MPLHASTCCSHRPSKGGRAKPDARRLGTEEPRDSRIRGCGEDVKGLACFLPSMLGGCNGESTLEILRADSPTEGLEAGTTELAF